uniref:Uncharacterized protein n=1 Tax=Globodera rostochiensis TaxID=31243 RepID=A0A914GRL5_GLORO
MARNTAGRRREGNEADERPLTYQKLLDQLLRCAPEASCIVCRLTADSLAQRIVHAHARLLVTADGCGRGNKPIQQTNTRSSSSSASETATFPVTTTLLPPIRYGSAPEGEEEVFQPPAPLLAGAHVSGMPAYLEMYRRCTSSSSRSAGCCGGCFGAAPNQYHCPYAFIMLPNGIVDALPFFIGTPSVNNLDFFKMSIEISFVDQRLLNFLADRLSTISETTLFIETTYTEARSWGIIRKHIWPIVKNNICFLKLRDYDLDCLQQTNPDILLDAPNLRAISRTPAQRVGSWLFAQREDHIPKMLRCSLSENVLGKLEDEFVSGIHSNDMTQEKLTLKHAYDNVWLLVRHPIEKDDEQWRVLEKMAIEWTWEEKYRITICFNDNGIGEGIVD